MNTFVIGLALVALLVAGCQDSGYQDVKVIFKTYGGFVPDEQASQELRISNGSLSYSVFARNGTLMKRVDRDLNGEHYSLLVSQLERMQFFSLNENQSPDVVVMDAGIGSIEVTLSDGSTRKVLIDPYVPEQVSEEMGKLNSILLSLIPQGNNVEEPSAEWIMNAPTYKFDGSGLELKEHLVLESFPEQHVLTYTFISNAAGYGDRTGKIIAQVITPHEIVVKVVNNQVVSAIIDGRWDEINQKE